MFGQKREPSPELDESFAAVANRGAVEDLVLLTTLTTDAIVKNCSERYFSDQIYTYIGPVLVSVNPFKRMQNVGPEYIDKYRGTNPQDLPPHIYAVADKVCVSPTPPLHSHIPLLTPPPPPRCSATWSTTTRTSA